MEKYFDEVGQIAIKYLSQKELGGLGAIDRMIADASADCDWDRMSKWHRVRFRMLRIEREWAGCEPPADSAWLSSPG